MKCLDGAGEITLSDSAKATLSQVLFAFGFGFDDLEIRMVLAIGLRSLVLSARSFEE